MKKVVFLSLLLTFAAGFLACKDSAKEEPRRDDGMKNTYYIEGVTLTPELLASTNLIHVEDHAYTEVPDSEFDAYIPGINVICATGNEILPLLFPDVDKYILDDKEVTEREFYAAPASMRTLVTFIDGTLASKSRKNVNDNNPYGDEMRARYLKWIMANVDTPLPDEIDLTDPKTYPADALVAYDWIMTTPESIAAKKPDELKGYILDMVGNIPHIRVFSSIRSLDYYGGDASTTMGISELGKAPTVANIATRLHSAPGQLQTIKSDSDQLTIITYPGE